MIRMASRKYAHYVHCLAQDFHYICALQLLAISDPLREEASTEIKSKIK